MKNHKHVRLQIDRDLSELIDQVQAAERLAGRRVTQQQLLPELLRDGAKLKRKNQRDA